MKSAPASGPTMEEWMWGSGWKKEERIINSADDEEEVWAVLGPLGWEEEEAAIGEGQTRRNCWGTWLAQTLNGTPFPHPIGGALCHKCPRPHMWRCPSAKRNDYFAGGNGGRTFVIGEKIAEEEK